MSEDETPLRRIAAELLRLYDWRFELAAEEEALPPFAGTSYDGIERDRHGALRANLREYGMRKKAAWDALRELLAKPTDDHEGL